MLKAEMRVATAFPIGEISGHSDQRVPKRSSDQFRGSDDLMLFPTPLVVTAL